MQQITLYGTETSPYVQRVEIVLLEANVKHRMYIIDGHNKPEWFVPLVNPAGKVPAITYGGPDALPDQPSKDSFKLAESLVIIEFISDLTPEAHLVPTDPVQRAKMRFFIATFETKFNPAFIDFVFYNTGSPEQVLSALGAIQDLLPETGYAVGEWSIADAAAGPFLGRAKLCFENGLGKFQPSEGEQVLEVLMSPKFARLRQYIEDVMARPSFQKTWDVTAVTEMMKQYV